MPTVTEDQLHTLTCAGCGAATRGALPAGVSAGGFGPRVQATVARLAGVYRLSHRATCEALRELFGTALLAEVATMFRGWHAVRDGTLRRATFVRKMRPLRARVEARLREGRACAHPRTAGMCAEILKLRPALWTFVEVPGVAPTNNQAERQIRRGVLWRKTSFGTHSEQGSRFAERILTASATLRQQGRSVVAFVMQAMSNRRQGVPARAGSRLWL